MVSWLPMMSLSACKRFSIWLLLPLPSSVPGFDTSECELTCGGGVVHDNISLGPFHWSNFVKLVL